MLGRCTELPDPEPLAAPTTPKHAHAHTYMPAAGPVAWSSPDSRRTSTTSFTSISPSCSTVSTLSNDPDHPWSLQDLLATPPPPLRVSLVGSGLRKNRKLRLNQNQQRVSKSVGGWCEVPTRGKPYYGPEI